MLQVIVVGTTSTSGNMYNAGINYVAAAPVTGATTDSFKSAMNNLGIATDNGPALAQNFDLTNSATGNNLSRDALQAAGITVGTGTGAGNTFSLDGATFTMPQLRTDPATHAVLGDNVIPDGQTIQIPPVTTSGVALLVTSSCGGSPAATATLGYSGARNDNPTIPAVGDWGSGNTNIAVMQLGHYDSGNNSMPNTSHQPRLYEVMLPANPTTPLTSITLPVMPVSFLTDTGTCPSHTPTLHVLAIGFRPAASRPSAGGAWVGAYDAPMDSAVPQSPAISDRTFRESVPLSFQGSGSAPTVRIHLSNAYSDTPVAFDAVTIAAQSATNGFAIVPGPGTVNFGGQACTVASGPCVTIPAGGDAYSDPVALPSMSGSSGKLTISLHVPVGYSVPAVPIHEQVQGLLTLWASGDATGNVDGSVFSNGNSHQGVDFLSGVDVSDVTATDGTLAVLGDQTTAAAPAFSTSTWPADLPSALSGQGITVPGSVVNASTSDAPPNDRWRMAGVGMETGTTVFDSGTTGTNNLTMNGGPTWSTDDPGTGPTPGSLSLTGSGQSAQSAGPVITSTSSFAVSAWVKLSSLPTRNAAVAAQDGTTNSSFYLGYNYSHSNTGVWAFYFAGGDASNPIVTGSYGPAAVANTWTLLTGVYNASASTIQLWVNGVPVTPSVGYTPSWSGNGAFTVGRDKYNGAATDYFPGEITDVRAYSRLLSGTDVRALAADGDMSTVTANNASLQYSNSAFEYIAASEPNLRDVIISLGANDVLRATADPGDVAQGTPESKLENDIGALVKDIQNRYAPSQSSIGVEVFITTIPALGLPASDPREQVREKVNTWLLAHGTKATDVFDIAGAVASSSSQNLINSTYLTGGVPNSAYYSAIANYIAGYLAPKVNGPNPSYSL